MTIPQCKHLKRRGAEVTSATDLFAWTPYLAEREDEFEPYKGPVPKPDMTNRERDNAPENTSPRMKLLIEAIAGLDPEQDFDKRTGAPKMGPLQTLAGDSVTLEERNLAWAAYQEQQKQK